MDEGVVVTELKATDGQAIEGDLPSGFYNARFKQIWGLAIELRLLMKHNLASRPFRSHGQAVGLTRSLRLLWEPTPTPRDDDALLACAVLWSVLLACLLSPLLLTASQS